MNIFNQMVDYVRTHGMFYTVSKALNKIDEHIFRRYHRWQKRNTPTILELEQQKCYPFSKTPQISIVVPVYNTKAVYLNELIDSVLAQTYIHFELCLLDGNSTNIETLEALQSASIRDKRIIVEHSEKNLGISGNTNLAIKMAKGDYIAFLDHDDLLTPDALYYVALAIVQESADMIYSDEDKINQESTYTFSPHFKPDFSPDYLRACNYICHFMVVKKDLIATVGMLNSAFDGSQDHDFALRISEKANCIIHIPRVLYHWRQLHSSMSHQNRKKCIDASSYAIKQHLNRLNICASVSIEAGRTQVRYHIPQNTTVSFILFKDMPSLYNLSYSHEIKIASPLLPRYQALNQCALNATKDILVFISQDIEIPNPSELETIIGRASLLDAGIVSPIVVYPNQSIRHQGYLVGMKNIVANPQQHQPSNKSGYFSIERSSHNISAASVACFAVRRSVFLSTGGFDELYQHDLGDVDFCLKLLKKRLFNITLPNCRVIYRSSASPESIIDILPNARDAEHFLNTYGTINDCYYNLNFKRDNGGYTI